MRDPTVKAMMIDDGHLRSIRKSIYHSAGPGFYVIRRFLPEEYRDHIAAFWTEHIEPRHTHKPLDSKEAIRRDCPNFFMENDQGDRIFYNFFWNDPADQVTYAAAFLAQIVRNQIESRPIFNEIYPGVIANRSACYRVIISKSAESEVRPHRDWDGVDPRRIQATLYLSKKGIDYTGKGFVFETTQGKQVVFGDDVEMDSGDLVFWRYNNVHSVSGVATSEDQIGFVRIAFPPELIMRNDIKSRIRSRPIVNRYVLPALRRAGKLWNR